jgi:hypothetical protein
MGTDDDWTQWPTRDLERLLSLILIMNEVLDGSAQALGIYVLARKIQEQ